MRTRKSTSVAAVSKWQSTDTSYVYSGTQTLMNLSTCVDDVHPGYRDHGSGDVGGSFDVTSTTYRCNPYFLNTKGQTSRWSVGNIWPVDLLYVNGTGATLGSLSDLDILSKGATAIARSSPTKPSFSMYNAVGELRRDGLPAISGLQTLKERSKYLRNSGSEYLNVEFGWMPLISDLQNFAKTVKKSSEIINQYRQGADQKIRRRYAFPSASTTRLWVQGQDGVGGAIMSPGVNFYNGFGSNGRLSIAESHETWFSGAFRYHIPVGDSFAARMERHVLEADKLLGIVPTPEAVWNLAPWSWAADWFANTGDVLANVSRLGVGGLVLQYGYMMDRYKSVRTVSCSIKSGYPSLETTTKRLKRRVATPFGFGVDMTKLSASQDAILVALGLSRGRR